MMTMMSHHNYLTNHNIIPLQQMLADLGEAVTDVLGQGLLLELPRQWLEVHLCLLKGGSRHFVLDRHFLRRCR